MVSLARPYILAVGRWLASGGAVASMAIGNAIGSAGRSRVGRISLGPLILVDIGDLGSGQFCDLFIISQWEKIERRLLWTKTTRNTLKHRVTGKLGHSESENCDLWAVTHSHDPKTKATSGHVKSQFPGNNF